MEKLEEINPKIQDLEYKISKNIRKLNNYFGDIYIKNWDLKDLAYMESRLQDIGYQILLLKKELKND